MGRGWWKVWNLHENIYINIIYILKSFDYLKFMDLLTNFHELTFKDRLPLHKKLSPDPGISSLSL